MNLRTLRRRLTPDWLRTRNLRRRRRRWIHQLGYQRTKLPTMLFEQPELMISSPLRFVVAEELLRKSNLTFLQIGAYDGVLLDDLQEIVIRHALRGVLVEPQPAAVAKLRETYRNQPQVTILQAAVAEKEGTRDLYTTRDGDICTASFDRDHLQRHGIPAEQIVARQVACHTVTSALAAAGLEHVDLIQIDAEGFDFEIIRSIDFQKLRPAILRFEHRHLSKSDQDDCLTLLASHGYRFLPEEEDIIAFRDTRAQAAPQAHHPAA